MGSASKKIVKANVLRLLNHAAGGQLPERESGVTRLKKLNITQGSAQRILDDESDLRLETLDQVAKGFRLAPWQLLVPNIDPNAPPELASSAADTHTGLHLTLAAHPLSAAEVRATLEALDVTGQALVGDILSAIRHRLAPPAEVVVRRDGSWSNEKLENAPQVADRLDLVRKALK